MKLIIVAILTVGAVGIAYMFSPRMVPAHADQPHNAIMRLSAGGSFTVWIIQDPDNGCQYLASYTGGVTPRMAPSGTQICASSQNGVSERDQKTAR